MGLKGLIGMSYVFGLHSKQIIFIESTQLEELIFLPKSSPTFELQDMINRRITLLLIDSAFWCDDHIFVFGFFRYSITKAFVVAFGLTFFSMLDVPVFWPILLCYWIFLFVLTMKRQILHMIKYKYVPFDMGKMVSMISLGIKRLSWLVLLSQ